VDGETCGLQVVAKASRWNKKVQILRSKRRKGERRRIPEEKEKVKGIV